MNEIKNVGKLRENLGKREIRLRKNMNNLF